MTIDWGSVDWWDLPGPSAFLGRAVDRLASDDGGLIGLSFPIRRPTGLILALVSALEQGRGLRAILVDARNASGARSPAHALAAAAGAPPGSIRSTNDFIESAALANAVFLIDELGVEQWNQWSLFFRTFRNERTRSGRISAPSLGVLTPLTLPLDEVEAVFGSSEVKWRDVVSRADMHLFVESRLGRSGRLAERAAVATVAEVACWDPGIALQLTERPIGDQIDPRQLLSALELKLGTPSWSNGLVDLMDGAPHMHTLALLGSRELLARRVWRAHVATIFPAIEQIRQAFVERYFGKLTSILPVTKTFQNNTQRTYHHPLELEINDVFYHLKDEIPPLEANLLRDLKTLRTSMAHMEPGDASLIVRASRSWQMMLGDTEGFAGGVGWDWPRCGQRLVLLVGPSGAGKSSYAAANYSTELVISADAIREELYGSHNMTGGQEAVFNTVRQRARLALAAGNSVVIDATNLRRNDRLLNATLVPADIAVDYVLIDRPMAEKLRDGGWRLEKKGLIEGHTNLLLGELGDILAGDGLPNVTVLDRRT
ncbi:hypothetical protein ABID19_006541 [Mesorhizobium robiniae]|uniref:AAA family ATPase n=1 Tax=Mesorhizobium robiniae TaxID=559315 RepID=A0ABV2GYV8_9HYPH|nr:AAA family ATPase [Mesorhizobium sp. ZC-5]MCV3243844.1 AAA family ATPase [Mesorhizobium sp. ZC-5]